MKYLKLCIIVFLFVGCDDRKEESIDFLEPQPRDVKNATSFNKHYQGSYINKDSSSLFITNNMIVKVIRFPLIFSRNDIDSTFKGDKSDNEQIATTLEKDGITVIRFEGDSVYSIWSVRDTIFKISDVNLCRFYKGAYFLNYTDDNQTWKVQRMDLNKNRLSLGIIMPDDSLFTILPVKDKSLIKDDSGVVQSYQIKPSRKELKKLLRNDVFEEWGVWIKDK